MFLERGKKKTGKGKVVSNAQNSVLRGLGKVTGILFLSFFLVRGKKYQRGKISKQTMMVKSKNYLKYIITQTMIYFLSKQNLIFLKKLRFNYLTCLFTTLSLFFSSYLLSLSTSACTLIKRTMWTMIVFSSRDPFLLNIENHGAFTSCSTHS